MLGLVAQLCLTHCDRMNCNPPGSSVHGISQARILEWVDISFSRGSFPDPGIKPRSPALQALSLLFEPLGKYGLLLASWGSHVALVVKNPPANAGDIWDASLIPRSGRSPGRGHGSILQYSCLENPMDREAWQASHACTCQFKRWLELPGEACTAMPVMNHKHFPFYLTFYLPVLSLTMNLVLFLDEKLCTKKAEI